MKLTREQIIELINQYIYANGQQLITGEQLNEILIVIANAFAMEGEASVGLDAVLERGDTVSNGRKINNNQGGAIKLAAEEIVANVLSQIIGIEVSDTENKGMLQISKGISTIGNISTTLEEDPTEKGVLDNMTAKMFPSTSKEKAVEPQSFSTGSLYISQTGLKPFTVGAHTLYVDETTQSLASVSNQGISGAVYHNQKDISYTSLHKIGINNSSLSIQAGDERSQSNQNAGTYSLSFTQTGVQKTFQTQSDINGQRWRNEIGEIVSIESSGFRLQEGKKIELTQGGNAPTAGLATLLRGAVVVNTSAVNAGSVISLTVQSEGIYTGNIRVIEIVENTSFTIRSTNNGDSCVVFWQIITLH